MEWYFSDAVEDLVVPKDYEQPEMIASPESWSQWGITAFGGSEFPKKNFNSITNITREELAFNAAKSFYTSVDSADSTSERRVSNDSSMSQGLYGSGGSLLWHDQADYRQFTEEEAMIDHVDDLFFRSLLEEDSTKDSTKVGGGTILSNNGNICEGGMVNSHSNGSQGRGMGSSKYLETHMFSPSMDWGNGEGSPSCLMPKQNESAENSTEESVLQDLERVTAQFTDKARLCFRDALYRLAESSKQSVHSCQDGERMLASDDDMLRVGETEDLESKTNVIDRAIASLMFSKFDSGEDDNGNTDEQRRQQVASCCQPLADFDGDAEVPIVGMPELQQPTAY